MRAVSFSDPTKWGRISSEKLQIGRIKGEAQSSERIKAPENQFWKYLNTSQIIILIWDFLIK